MIFFRGKKLIFRKLSMWSMIMPSRVLRFFFFIRRNCVWFFSVSQQSVTTQFASLRMKKAGRTLGVLLMSLGGTSGLM